MGYSTALRRRVCHPLRFFIAGAPSASHRSRRARPADCTILRPISSSASAASATSHRGDNWLRSCWRWRGQATSRRPCVGVFVVSCAQSMKVRAEAVRRQARSHAADELKHRHVAEAGAVVPGAGEDEAGAALPRQTTRSSSAGRRAARDARGHPSCDRPGPSRSSRRDLSRPTWRRSSRPSGPRSGS